MEGNPQGPQRSRDPGVDPFGPPMNRKEHVDVDSIVVSET